MLHKPALNKRLRRLGLLLAALTVAAGNLSASTPARFVEKNRKAIYKRLDAAIKASGVLYPPKMVRLAVFKAERRLELWLPDANGAWRFVKDYKFTAMSGSQGPKLYYGDLQIPEGIYGIDRLDLSPEYHLAMHVDHPNEFDRAMIELEGRDPRHVSTGINVHGGAISYGCVVIGDRNIEEVFMLSFLAGKENTQLYIFPHDTIRSEPEFKHCEKCPVWYGELTRHLEQAIKQFSR
ncbi:L,D-transpeptidase family protein [Turneriella parva]|uniref:L,D-TPase catalytic domain-containing protein n=1 Tax=Turneriella parva (strain ATCC BAA-1111 / DSM 21527 / NCTC 11395 / H) TaxID=869212 RepID=I4BAG1_TURPD|nr:hypothetical protein [Turneriella parva]AFM14268.1 hypothetical protein Turpa_3634 [Turneriella parva DSM 21527]